MNISACKKWARTAVAILLTVVMIAVPFLVVFLTGVLLPPQYGQTYYAELHQMYSRLRDTKGSKVVVVGNSAVPFGVDSALMEELLAAGGLNYTVCNFGLYGALGTKMMLELSLPHIGRGDIVIFMPEIAAQPLSLYFSGEEAWYALDSGMEMYYSFSSDTRAMLAGSFFGYTAKKYALHNSGTPAAGSGIYALSSFDDRCDLKNYDRSYNSMNGGYDVNNPIVLSSDYYAGDFVGYVNDYYASISAVGAEMYYAFPPMNASAVGEGQDVNAFAEQVCASFNFPVLNDISDCIMESGWFYDSNFHLNSSGMTVFTVGLVNGLKNMLGNTTKTQVDLPERPIQPDPGIEGEGDNSCADCFTYRREGNYYIVTGLTDAGAQRTELVVPYQVDGLYVSGLQKDVFAGNTTVRSITIQDNISLLYDGCFSGCSSLASVYLQHTDPSAISVGYSLLDGAPRVLTLYVPAASLNSYMNNYFWGSYAQSLRGY